MLFRTILLLAYLVPAGCEAIKDRLFGAFLGALDEGRDPDVVRVDIVTLADVILYKN